ncbi:MAG TPA: hypothetical protein PK838_08790 [Thermoleophilia bacterium]|jgi:hypothetical protein|nr:hypothetical protein [Thermoleophilia bacterium]
MTNSRDGATPRLWLLGGLVTLLVATLLLLAALSPAPAEAAKWRTKLAGKGRDNEPRGRLYGPTKTKLKRAHATRLRFWTAREWDADDREWEYDWVRFKLIRVDTGKVVKSFGPYYRPTGVKKWRTVSIKLPKGARRYRLRAISDDARYGFQLQQRH